MSYSNYPPGVTGAEGPIAGPSFEGQAEVTCPECEDTFTTWVEDYKYEGTRYFCCERCGDIVTYIPEETL